MADIDLEQEVVLLDKAIEEQVQEVDLVNADNSKNNGSLN